MKTITFFMLLAFCGSLFAETSVPFYFAVTENAMAPLQDNSWKKISVKEVATEKAYLRGYTFQDKNILVDGAVKKTSAEIVKAKKTFRRNVVKELLKKGVLQNGDVVLTFRTNWEHTTAYPHVQMGVSHSGLIFVEGGNAYNLDMPLDADYNGALLNSSMDSNHYLESDAFHIVRPRDFGVEKQKNLLSWIQVLKKNYNAIRNEGFLRFNSDYMDAKFDKYLPGDAFVTTLARILNGQNKKAKDLTMYCSEFVWAMLSLSNCGTSDLISDSGVDATCVEPIFDPLPMVGSKELPGLTEGPLAVLETLDISVSEKVDLLGALFYQGAPEGLSPGHRALATNPGIQKLIGIMRPLYTAKLAGETVVPFPAPGTPIDAIAAQISAESRRNYSPTSYLINAMIDATESARKFDYVATLLFTP